MSEHLINSVNKTSRNYRVKSPVQTGFSSPATHYSEPRLDLNEILIGNASATFYVRVSDDSFADFGITENNILIIDKSINPSPGQLVLVTTDGEFKIATIKKDVVLEVWGVITYVIKSVSP